MAKRFRLGFVACLVAGGTILVLALPGSSPAGNLVLCGGSPATIAGTSGDDVIYGTTHADVINAQGGADEVHARAGNDKVCGADGGDTLIGGDDADEIHGDFASDDLFGGRGSDFMDGGSDKGGDDDLCDGGKPTRPDHPRSDPDRALFTCERIRDALELTPPP